MAMPAFESHGSLNAIRMACIRAPYGCGLMSSAASESESPLGWTIEGQPVCSLSEIVGDFQTSAGKVDARNLLNQTLKEDDTNRRR
jgi:hypothetical protein